MSKYLIATKESQGLRSTDFNFCEEGEPVMIGIVDNDMISLVGIKSKKGCTTFEVVEFPESFTDDPYYKSCMDASHNDVDLSKSLVQKSFNLFDCSNMRYQVNSGDIVERKGKEIIIRKKWCWNHIYNKMDRKYNCHTNTHISCPECQGYGRWIERYEGDQPIYQICPICKEVGYVPDPSPKPICDHSWGAQVKIGNCLYNQVCEKCGEKREIDTSG